MHAEKKYTLKVKIKAGDFECLELESFGYSIGPGQTAWRDKHPDKYDL